MERKKENNINRKGHKKKINYTPPVYPAVYIPVPDLDWKKLGGKNIPCCMKLLVYIITKVLP